MDVESINARITKTLSRPLAIKYRNWAAIQDEYIRVAIAAYADLVDTTDLPAKICKSHKKYYCKHITDGDTDSLYYTQEPGAESRTLNNMICEGTRFAINNTERLIHNKWRRVILPLNFEAHLTGDFINLRNLFVGHILPHLANGDLLALAMVCKFTNNIVMNNTLFGQAITFSRNPIFPRERKEMMTYDGLRYFADALYRSAKAVHTKLFTDLVKSFPATNFEIISVKDLGDATVVDNPEANGECFMSEISRRNFTIKISGALFNVSLILQRPYEARYQNGEWRERLWGKARAPVIDAKSVKMGKIEAYVEFIRSPSLNIVFGNYSQSGPGQFCLPVKPSDLNYPCWLLPDLELFTGLNKEELLNNMGIDEDKYFSYREDFEYWADEDSTIKQGINNGLIISCYKAVEPLAYISFGKKDGDVFMKLWQGHANYKIEDNNLPLNRMRHPPKEWRKFNESIMKYSGINEDRVRYIEKRVETRPIGWDKIFTARDTINDGLIVFKL